MIELISFFVSLDDYETLDSIAGPSTSRGGGRGRNNGPENERLLNGKENGEEDSSTVNETSDDTH